MGSTSAVEEPTMSMTYQANYEEEDEKVGALERKRASFPRESRTVSADSSNITNTTSDSSSSTSFSSDSTDEVKAKESAVDPSRAAAVEKPELFHGEHNGEKNDIVYFDGEQATVITTDKPDTENGSSVENKKQLREIGVRESLEDPPKVVVDHQPNHDVLEEEADVEKVIKNQETHDLFCPYCNSCITKRVILKKRKRAMPHEIEDAKRGRQDNVTIEEPIEGSSGRSFLFRCLSCFGLFSTEVSERNQGDIREIETPLLPQQAASAKADWSFPLLWPRKKETVIGTGDSRDQSSGVLDSSSENPTGSKARDDAVADDKSVDKESHDDNSKSFSKKDDLSNGIKASDKVILAPILPVHNMEAVGKVTVGPFEVKTDMGNLNIEGSVHQSSFTVNPASFPINGSGDKIEIITDPKHVETDTSGSMAVSDVLPTSSLVPVATDTEAEAPRSLRRVSDSRKLEILKSIVYGGLIESITSLGVISSAAGSGVSTLNILIMGLANLAGGLILIVHNLQELREERPRTAAAVGDQVDDEEKDRYKRLLGRRENFKLHATIAIISFVIFGIIPPAVYGLSFRKSDNRDYKALSVLVASLVCIFWLAIGKAHVRTPRGYHLKSVLYYMTIAFSVSGVSYFVGHIVSQLLEKYGWSDGSETPAELMIPLMGRKAGFGYSSY